MSVLPPITAVSESEDEEVSLLIPDYYRVLTLVPTGGLRCCDDDDSADDDQDDNNDNNDHSRTVMKTMVMMMMIF